jgi:hypothetical protein
MPHQQLNYWGCRVLDNWIPTFWKFSFQCVRKEQKGHTHIKGGKTSRVASLKQHSKKKQGVKITWDHRWCTSLGRIKVGLLMWWTIEKSCCSDEQEAGNSKTSKLNLDRTWDATSLTYLDGEITRLITGRRQRTSSLKWCTDSFVLSAATTKHQTVWGAKFVVSATWKKIKLQVADKREQWCSTN